MDIARLIESLRQHRLLKPAQLDALLTEQAQFSDASSLAKELVQRGWLTSYQAKKVLDDRGSQLLLGSYVLLDKLGEGGMGAVFKARNWKLGKLVAIKVIRKERLDNDEAIRRFHREIRVAAALNHPNIVHAFDADEVGSMHLLVMEYVEGMDLAKLVTQHGPPTIEAACEFIRQAALGLQHAHEHNLVHRDIKPHNLLLTADGKTVKILDMGLARMIHTSDASMTGTTMTKEGSVLGTPDYMAPEQAMEAHDVDIRADLYSLGCTFYFLLTGRTPFAAKMNLTEKLVAHQFDEAPLLESFRPDVPADVSAIVRKLLAKKPEERYQTPGELATVLAEGLGTGMWPAHPQAVAVPMALPVDELSAADVPMALPVEAPAARPAPASSGPTQHFRESQGERRARRLIYITTAASIVLALVGTGIVFFILQPTKKPDGLRPFEAAITVTVAANKSWQDSHVDVVPGQSVSIQVSGKWTKGADACGPEGLKSTDRDRNIVIEAPALCLLARVGDEPPVPVQRGKSITATQSSRLFLRINDLDVEENSGTLRVELTGGRKIDTDAPTPTPTKVEQAEIARQAEEKKRAADAETALRPLAARVADGKSDADTLIRELIDFRVKYAGTPAALKAAELFTRFASPLDKLDREQIPKDERFDWQPRELVGVIGSHKWKHWGTTTAVAIHPSGDYIASGGTDNVIRIWERATGREHAVLKGHAGAIASLVYGAGGTLLASGSADATIMLWDVDEEPTPTAPRFTLVGHSHAVTWLEFAPDGRQLASMAANGAVKLWNVASGAEKRLEQLPEMDAGVAPSFGGVGRWLLGGGKDGALVLWNCADGKQQRLFPARPADAVHAVCFAPDRKTLAFGDAAGAIRLWSLAFGKEVELGTLRGHTGAVTRLAFSPDGKTLASTSQADNTTRLWDMPTALGTNPKLAKDQAKWERNLSTPEWTVLEPIKYESKGGATLTKLPDNSILASGKEPLTDAYEVELQTNLQGITAIRLEVLPDASLPANGPGRSTNGNFVLSAIKVTASPRTNPNPNKSDTITFKSASADWSQIGWGGADHPVDNVIKGHANGWAIGPHMGKPHWVVFEASNPFGHEDGMVLRINVVQDSAAWGLNTIGRFRISATTAPRLVRATSISIPDDIAAIIRIASEKRSAERKEALARYYRAEAALKTTLPGGGALPAQLFSPDGQALAQPSADGRVRLWSTEAPKPNEYVWIDDETPNGANTALDDTNQSWTLVARPNHPVLSGTKSVLLAGKNTSQQYFISAADGVRFTESSKLFAHVYVDPLSPPQQIVLRWHGPTGWQGVFWGENLIGWGVKNVGAIPDKGKWVRLDVDPTTVGFKPGDAIDGVAFAQHGGTVYFDKAGIVTTGPKRIAELRGQTAAWDPAGKFLATVGGDQMVRLWDPSNGKELYPSQNQGVVAMSPDGKTLVLIRDGGQLLNYHVATGETTKVCDTVSGLKSVAISPDGKRIAGGSSGGGITLWIEGKRVLTFQGHIRSIDTLAYSPDGKTLAGGSWLGNGNWAGTVKLWEPIGGKEQRALLGHAHRVHGIAFSTDGALLASASEDKTVKLWKKTTGKETMTLKGHAGPVYSVAFNPDGRILASSGSDSIRLWETASGQEFAVLGLGGLKEITRIVFAPDGRHVVVGNANGTIYILRLALPPGTFKSSDQVTDEWLKAVANLPAYEQVKEVTAKLVGLNPGFDGKVTHKIENGVVTELALSAHELADLSPVRALEGLQRLYAGGPKGAPGKLTDLSPLRGMRLTRLNVWNTSVADLSPLKGMPLTELRFGTTRVTDLSPLQGMPLTTLGFSRARVTDLAPLKGMPLRELRCDYQTNRDAAILRAIKTLETINGKPAAEFWKEVDASKPK